jgi:hypothetical protein
MIAYQEYNTRSPLNGLAAKWAAEHSCDLPIDSRVVAPVGDAAAETISVNIGSVEVSTPTDLPVETATVETKEDQAPLESAG